MRVSEEQGVVSVPEGHGVVGVSEGQGVVRVPEGHGVVRVSEGQGVARGVWNARDAQDSRKAPAFGARSIRGARAGLQGPRARGVTGDIMPFRHLGESLWQSCETTQGTRTSLRVILGESSNSKRKK